MTKPDPQNLYFPAQPGQIFHAIGCYGPGDTKPTADDLYVITYPVILWRLVIDGNAEYVKPITLESISDDISIWWPLPDGRLLSSEDRVADNLDEAKKDALHWKRHLWDLKQKIAIEKAATP